MTKRKIDNTTIINDLDPTISEILSHCTYSRKRSANLQARRKKITKQDYGEKFPWFLHIPCRKRSKRKISHKNTDHDADAVSKQDKKLDSRALISHKNADYDADAVSKQDKKLDSRALICNKDADNADGDSERTKKLDSGTFECYLENLWRSFSEDQRTSCTYLDCLWFTLYKKVPQRSKVLSWINKKDIFSKKYVFVPIVCWSHWNLLILCNFGESLQSETRTTCMLLLDSLEGADPRRLEPDIRKFIFDIYKAEGRSETKDQIRKIPLLVPKVPQQRDGEECGSFVLYFINLFMEGAPEDFSMKGYPYFMKKSWFTREGLKCFCKRLDSFPK